MIYPVFNKALMPNIALSFTASQETPTKYMGNKIRKGERSFDLDFFTSAKGADTEIAALYAFWKTECQYGSIPFLIALNFFGSVVNNSKPNFLVKFAGRLTGNSSKNWVIKQKFIVVGDAYYEPNSFIPIIVYDNYIVHITTNIEDKYVVDSNDNYVQNVDDKNLIAGI